MMQFSTALAISIDPEVIIAAWKHILKTCVERYTTMATTTVYYTSQAALRSVEGHGKALEAANGIVQVPLRLTVEFDATHLACERPEQRFALYSGHGLAHATMYPEPESQVSGCLAGDVEPVGVLPTTRVAVGRPEEDHHPIVLCDFDT